MTNTMRHTAIKKYAVSATKEHVQAYLLKSRNFLLLCGNSQPKKSKTGETTCIAVRHESDSDTCGERIK